MMPALGAEIVVERPNRPLVVKCGYEGSTRRVTFPSAQTCRLDSLRARVEECFALSASPFNLSYTDDDGEEFSLRNEIDFTEAISYFTSGDDDQALSTYSGDGQAHQATPSYSLQKINLRLEVVVEYDGPSLSDTSSILSFTTSVDDGESRGESSRSSRRYADDIASYTSQNRQSRVYVDDEVTEYAGSQNDRHSRDLDAHLGELQLDGAKSEHPIQSPMSETTNIPGHHLTLSRQSSGRSSTRRGRLRVSPHDSPGRDSRQPLPLTGTDSGSAPSLLTHSELGTRWLREQSNLATARRVGARPGRSRRSRRDDSDESDDGEEASVEDIALVQDARGKFYYSYGEDEDQAGPSHRLQQSRLSRTSSASDPVASLGPVVSDCAACGTQLEYLKYVCCSCGNYSDGIAKHAFELCATCIEVHGVAHVRQHASDSIRHTFREKIWGDTGWTDVEYSEDSACSICGDALFRNRFRCVSCPKFDLCRSCHQEVGEIHPAHVFLSLPDKPSGDSPLPSSSQMNGVTSKKAPVKHPGAFCHNCLRDIVGPRFHCAVCPSWDLCIDCEGKASTDESSGHTSDHIMMKIPLPLGHNEVEAVSRRARDRWIQRDSTAVAEASRAGSIRVPSLRSPSPTGETVYAGSQGRQVPNGYHPPSQVNVSANIALAGRQALDHRIKCSECHEWIVGQRYQCANCTSEPEAFNLCSTCEVKSFRVHDPRHVFFKLDRPVNFPLTSPDPLLPLLYKSKVGEVPPSATVDPNDPMAYLKHVIHRETLCDIHSDQIRGAWFRCAHCADGFDVCQDAVQSANHDPSHVFVVFKARVNMNAFRQLAKLEEAQSEPLLKQQAYMS